MCGIAGIVHSQTSRVNINALLAAQAHRGPDNQGIYNDDTCTLGHNRLSIIDITNAANQPFTDQSQRFVLVFNGEIYNYKELKQEIGNRYRFITNSDTEVLLASYCTWGEACLHKLNGMFAFAIWDKEKKELFAARDRFGVKPFYYSHNKRNDEFIFASEIKSLWVAGINKEYSQKTWASYFAYGSYGLPEETFWENIAQLPAGHNLKFSNNKLVINKWYDFVSSIKNNQTEYNNISATYEALLLDAIKLRFRADVPIAFNISGGLDSSVLLGIIHKHVAPKNITAYTFDTGHSYYDETPWVKKMIASTGYPLTPCTTNAEEVPELAMKLANIQDEPYGGLPTITYSKVFEQARKDGNIVLLDGQGMDEAWAGYDYYHNKSNHLIQGSKDSPVRPESLNPDFLSLAEKNEYPKPFDNTLQNLQYRDLFYTKIPRALRFNDRISMAASTELREPFLDYRLIEMAFALPKTIKLKEGQNKWPLRQLSSKYLPEDIAFAPKRPLQTPQREWLRKELKEWATDHIKTLIAHDGGTWFDAKALETNLEKFMKAESDNSFFIWQWISLSLSIARHGSS